MSKNFFYSLFISAFTCGFATYINFIQGKNSDLILTLITLDIIILILLLLVVSARLIWSIVSRRKGNAGAIFHARLVIVFSLLAIAPTVVIYSISSTLFERGVQALVGNFTKDVVQKSLEFSDNVKNNLKMNMEGLVKNIAKDIQRQFPNDIILTDGNKSFLWHLYRTYELSHLLMISQDQSVIFSTDEETNALLSHFSPPLWDTLNQGLFVVYFSEDNNLIIAAYPLKMNEKLVFLFISHPIQSFFPKHFYEISALYQTYQSIEKNRWHIRFMFMTIYGVFALLSLLITIGVGILLADHISQPISQLVDAAQKIRNGQLNTRIKIKPNILEFLGLAKAFNLMVTELEKQRDQLEKANLDIQRRKNFIETTLKGLSSGVIGLDEKNDIQVINDAACEILGLSHDKDSLPNIQEILPDLNDFLDQSPLKEHHDTSLKSLNTLIMTEREHKLHYLSTHISHITGSNDIKNVITIDDITELHLAQKKAAWGDVARRVAHEIKNPLTPIQLSAERLKRKLSQLLPAEEKELFNANIEIIIRHVDEIERIVNEFSRLARMPTPILHERDIVPILKRCVNLQKNAYDTIEFKEIYPEYSVFVLCDEQLLGQAFSNILKNAVEALTDIHEINTKLNPKVLIELTVIDKNVIIKFIDNGKGFPKNMIQKFLEPYITTKQTGTGLGLTITKKIIDDHHGSLDLINLNPYGAQVALTIPLHQ